MANGVVVLVAVFSVAAAILISVLVLYKISGVPAQPEPPRRGPVVRPMVERSESTPPQPIETSASPKTVEPDRQASITVKVENVNTPPPASSASKDMDSNEPSAPLKPTGIIDVQAGFATAEERNERILAGISQNIRKSMQMRPVPQHSP